MHAGLIVGATVPFAILPAALLVAPLSRNTKYQTKNAIKTTTATTTSPIASFVFVLPEVSVVTVDAMAAGITATSAAGVAGAGVVVAGFVVFCVGLRRAFFTMFATAINGQKKNTRAQTVETLFLSQVLFGCLHDD